LPNLRDDLRLAKGHRVRFATYASGFILGAIAIVTLHAVWLKPDQPPQWALNLISLLASGAIAYLFAEQSNRSDS